MKRGLITLVSLLSIPLVSAKDSPFEMLMGTTDESLIFLKLMYGMLIFVIMLKASKQFMFKGQGQKNLGGIFALLIAIFTFRFTSDAVVQGIGWIITILAPFLIIFMITGVFQKKVTGDDAKKIPWLRITLSLIATILLFAFLGDTTSFGGGRAGAVDEMFSDVHYLLFSKLDTMWIALIGIIAIALLVYLLTRLTGRGVADDKGRNDFGTWFLRVLGIIAVLFLLSFIAGSGFSGIVGGIAGLPWGWIIAIAVLIILLYFPFTRRLLMWLLKRPLKIIGWGFNRGRGNRLFVELRTQRFRLNHGARGWGRRFFLDPSQTMPIVFIVRRGRWEWTASRIENAQVTLTVNNGTIAPANGTTNGQGNLPATYTAPTVAGRATLNVTVTHPESAPSIIQPFEIQIGYIGPAVNVIVNSPINIDRGNTAEIITQVTNAAGDGVDNANITIAFTPSAGMPAIPAFTGVTLGGGPRTAAAVSFRTPVFDTPGTYRFNVRTRVPGTANPPDVPGVVNVNNPGTPNLVITNRVARTGTLVLTTNGSPPANPLRAGQHFYIEAAVAVGGVPTNGATLTLSPLPGFTMTGFTRTGTGQYRATVSSTVTTVPTTYPFSITATQAGCNNAVENIDVEVKSFPGLNATSIIPPGILYVGTPVNVQIQVTDSETGNPVNMAPVEIRRGNTSVVSGSTNPTGIYTFTYNPTTAGNISFNAIITAPAGYGAGTDISFTLNFVARQREIGLVVSWFPEPVKTFTRVVFTAIDRTTGNPLPGANIAITDLSPGGANSIHILNAAAMLTDGLGHLPAALEIGLNRVITTPEVHRIEIVVTHGGYSDTTGVIDVTFNPLGVGYPGGVANGTTQTRAFI
jgi:hypothetical protein